MYTNGDNSCTLAWIRVLIEWWLDTPQKHVILDEIQVNKTETNTTKNGWPQKNMIKKLT